MKRDNHFLIYIAEILLLIEFVAITWLCSGTRVPYMMVMVSISILSFLCIVVDRIFTKKVNVISRTECCAYVLSFLFLAYVFIQSVNVRVLKVPADGYSIYIAQDYCSFLPSCVSDAFLDFNNTAYFALYLGLVCFGLSCFSLLKNMAFAKIVSGFFIVNALAMGIFAIWQKENYSIMYNRFFSDGEFYGTFFLKNAAGAFFSFAIVCALYLVLTSAKIMCKKILSCLFLLAISLIFSYNVYDSESEGAMLFGISIWCCFFGVLLLAFLSKFFELKKMLIYVSGAFLLSLTFWVAFLFFSNKMCVIPPEIKVSINSREDINKHNISIFKNAPVFGIGTSGYDYQLSKVEKQNRDYSKVYKYLAVSDPHNSIFAYFIRHGVVGGILIALMGLLWGAICWKRRKFIRKENIFILLGLGCCLVYGLIDMHLSSIPSTMYIFVFLLALGTPRRGENSYESVF
ncbi:MAG: O-antigen ligase family protein [Candidatus Merdousia sp.]|nr:O-antigen ligase family protein [Candidatus Merdousia sp.]